MLSNELLSVGPLGTTGLTYGLIESDGLVGGLQAEDGLAIGLLGGGCPFGGLEDLVGGLVGVDLSITCLATTGCWVA